MRVRPCKGERFKHCNAAGRLELTVDMAAEACPMEAENVQSRLMPVGPMNGLIAVGMPERVHLLGGAGTQ